MPVKLYAVLLSDNGTHAKIDTQIKTAHIAIVARIA